jgi:threonine dehydrogenase-like Zn-dependent dehydrogenase
MIQSIVKPRIFKMIEMMMSRRTEPAEILTHIFALSDAVRAANQSPERFKPSTLDA